MSWLPDLQKCVNMWNFKRKYRFLWKLQQIIHEIMYDFYVEISGNKIIEMWKWVKKKVAILQNNIWAKKYFKGLLPNMIQKFLGP